MGKKAISNTFTVNTIDDGQSAPYYFQEWFAWSNDATTASVTTEPTIGGSWATSIPAQGSYAYLWRKVVRQVLNNDGQTYTPETAQYFRMSGLNGTSIKTKGTIIAIVSSRESLPTTDVADGDIAIKDRDRTPYRASLHGMILSWEAMSNADDGDSYVVDRTCYYPPAIIDPTDVKGHLISYSEEAGMWLDLGQFQGESGETWYTHVAWATNVDTSTTPITVTDFVTTKSPNDTTHIWMGVLVDQNSGQDSSNAALYTWSNTKGDGTAVATCSPDKISIQCNADGSVVSTKGYSVSFGLKVGSIDISQYITDVTRGSLPTGVSISSTPVAYAKTIVVSDTATATGMASGITFTVTGTYEGKTYSSTVNVALIGVKQGSVGERGKVGRFFYYAGTFNSQDNDPTHVFVVNDAQAPYFEHTENGQKRYHVFNYETNGSYTMAQMWSISSSSWNNSPWEAMTNDFKYIITQALFSSYAHLGSWIFNSDYMISEKDRNGNPRGQQEYNGMPSNAQVTTGFIPSVAFDAANGRVSFCGDRARFNPDGSGWFANKNIQWDANGNANFYGKITATSGSLENIIVGPEDGDHIEIGTQEYWGNIVGKNAAGDSLFSINYKSGYPYIDFTKDTNEWSKLDYGELHIQKVFNGGLDANFLELRDDLIWFHQIRNDSNAGSFSVEFDSNNKIKMMATTYLNGGNSIWPEYSYLISPDNMTTGLVHVMSLSSLKAILNGTSYSDRLNKLSVLLIRNNV